MGNNGGSDGYSNKGGGDGNGNNMRNGNSNEGWQAMKRAMARAARAMMTATKRAMATVAKVMAMATKRAMATIKEGNVDDGKSNGRHQQRGQGQRGGREEVWQWQL
jgi:hypothetical protein